MKFGYENCKIIISYTQALFLVKQALFCDLINNKKKWFLAKENELYFKARSFKLLTVNQRRKLTTTKELITMTIEAVNQFLTKVNEDEKFHSELSQAMGTEKDRAAAVELAAQHGYEFTLEELATQIEQLKRIQAGEQLSEEELEAVAGGATPTPLAGAFAAKGAVGVSATKAGLIGAGGGLGAGLLF